MQARFRPSIWTIIKSVARWTRTYGLSNIFIAKSQILIFGGFCFPNIRQVHANCDNVHVRLAFPSTIDWGNQPLVLRNEVDSTINRTAYSIAEIVIVVLILGILTAAAVPKLQESFARHSLLVSARRVAADIRLARSTAMTRSFTQKVTFDIEDSSYELPGVTAYTSGPANYQVELSNAPYRSRFSRRSV